MALSPVDSKEVVSRTIRDEPPTHFELRIKSFSLLSNSSLERYESGNFEAGGYKWKPCLYPKGNKDKNGEGHISLYLEISETNSLSPGWEVHALFRLLLLDQLGDKYLGIQVIDSRRIYLYPKGTGQEKGKSLSLFLHLDDSNTLLASRGLYVEVQLRLVDQINGEHVEHKLRTWFNDSSKNWGRRKFLSLNSLRDQSKSYLVKDVCIIEAHFLLVGAIEKLGQRVK